MSKGPTKRQERKRTKQGRAKGFRILRGGTLERGTTPCTGDENANIARIRAETPRMRPQDYVSVATLDHRGQEGYGVIAVRLWLGSAGSRAA